jgi:hypothetical protein
MHGCGVVGLGEVISADDTVTSNADGENKLIQKLNCGGL